MICPQTVWGRKVLQQLGAGHCGEGPFFRIAVHGDGNEVSSQDNQVGTKLVDHRNRRAQRMHGKKWVVVKVAELGDGEPIQALR